MPLTKRFLIFFALVLLAACSPAASNAPNQTIQQQDATPTAETMANGGAQNALDGGTAVDTPVRRALFVEGTLEDDVGNRIKKRFYDMIVSSLVIILILSWLVPLIALLIWIESRGPIFFIQQRSGKNGKTFNCIKFRSMKVNREAHEKQAVKNDARITRMGKFMRKTNIDELPQFFNVIRGDMSLVGPRPPLPYEVEAYDVWHRRRLLEARPGITGLWQVNGRCRTKFDEMVRLDLQYARKQSLLLDLKILLRTPAAVLSGAGYSVAPSCRSSSTVFVCPANTSPPRFFRVRAER